MGNPNEKLAKKYFEEVLGEKVEEISGGIISVNKEDFDTVKIQFIALKVVDVAYLKTTDGGMGLFWRLTPRGKTLMINRRAIRRK